MFDLGDIDFSSPLVCVVIIVAFSEILLLVES
jgi:hypothetical protein